MSETKVLDEIYGKMCEMNIEKTIEEIREQMKRELRL